MTSIYELYETDQALEIEGHWYEINPKTAFLLARAGGANLKFAKAMEKKMRPHRGRGGAFEDDKVDVELGTDIMREAFAETIIMDWKGITDRKGKKVPFSPAAAVTLLKDLPDLFVELREASGKVSNFRLDEVKEDVGNS